MARCDSSYVDERRMAIDRYIDVEPPDQKLPQKIEPQKPIVGARSALVQCEGFRCLAFQDKNGKWVDAHGHALTVLEVIREM